MKINVEIILQNARKTIRINKMTSNSASWFKNNLRSHKIALRGGEIIIGTEKKKNIALLNKAIFNFS